MTKPKNDYFIDPESAAEMARLLMQDRVYTEVLEENFPIPVLQLGSRIIDIGCGPGGWLLNLVKNSITQGITAVGVDIDKKMIQYAQGQAEALELEENISFEEMDISIIPWPLPDASFDLVHGRLIGFFPPPLWATIISEMVRIARPGGIVRLTETEMSVSNHSPALEQEHQWFFQSLYRSGQSHSSDGHRVTITASLAAGLRRSGLHNVQARACALEWSSGTKAHSTMFEDFQIGFKLLEPFYLATGIATQDEINQTFTHMVEQMQQPDFTALQYFLTAQGLK